MGSLSNMTDVQLILDFIPQIAQHHVRVAIATVTWYLHSVTESPTQQTHKHMPKE